MADIRLIPLDQKSIRGQDFIWWQYTCSLPRSMSSLALIDQVCKIVISSPDLLLNHHQQICQIRMSYQFLGCLLGQYGFSMRFEKDLSMSLNSLNYIISRTIPGIYPHLPEFWEISFKVKTLMTRLHPVQSGPVHFVW